MNKEKLRKTQKKIFKILGLLFLIWLVIRVAIAIRQNASALSEVLPESHVIPSEDSSLLPVNTRSRIEVIQINNSKVRSPISVLRFNKSFNLLTYKIDLAKSSPLKTLLHVSVSSSNTSVGYSYGVISSDVIYQLDYLAGKPKPAQDIYLTLAGDSLQTVFENDSMISYHLNCKNFSIKYDRNDPVDLFVESEEKPFEAANQIPTDLLFLERGKKIYLLIMTPKDFKSSIPADLLYQIVSGNVNY